MSKLLLNRALLSLFCFAVWVMAGSAFAEIWGYVDAQGVGHFSATKLDDRYELFSKETTVRPEPVEGQPTDFDKLSPNGIAVSTLSPKLAKFFESSTTLKTVRPHMQDAAKTHRIDIELLQALIAAESGFNATAISPKGALGLMQLMPATAQRYGVHGDKRITQQQKLFDPQTNIHAGARYLRDLLNLFHGKVDLALAAYNAGEGAVQKAGNKIPNYPETQNYVRTVTQMYAALKPPVPSQAMPTKALEPKRPASSDPLRPTKGRGNGVPLSLNTNTDTDPFAPSGHFPYFAGATHTKLLAVGCPYAIGEMSAPADKGVGINLTGLSA